MASKFMKKHSMGQSRLSVLQGKDGLSAWPDQKRPRISIWPEWNDADVSTEKWESTKKEEKRSKSPTVVVHFDDPDGKLEMPPSLKVDSWKRPVQFIQDKLPVVVAPEQISLGFNLVLNNEHLHESEFIRHCISQIVALWEMSSVNVTQDFSADMNTPGDDRSHTWYPWEHIYSLCKAGKGPHIPLYNSYGKYAVRLYWMGSWRKIMVDDNIPFDDQGRMLLPSTALNHELWPMLLTKALIKVASLDYTGGSPNQEFGDMSVIQCLTGWIPEAIPLQQSHKKEVWELLKTSIPEWKLPLQEWEKPLETVETPGKYTESSSKDEKTEKESATKDGKDKVKSRRDSKEKDRGGKEEKKDKKDKGKTKEKMPADEKSAIEEFLLPEKPETVMFAAYGSTPKYPVKVSVLGEMADASEKLRENGLSHLHSHVVYIAQTRSYPLQPPPPALVVPSWKLIRPRKRKDTPLDEPVDVTEEPQPIQSLEIVSPFLNYKVSPVPIPVETHRPKSSLERHGTKSRIDDIIEERDESKSYIQLEPKHIVSPVIEVPKTRESRSPKLSIATGERSTHKHGSTHSGHEKPTDFQNRESSKHTFEAHLPSDNAGGLAPPDMNGTRQNSVVFEETEPATESGSLYTAQKAKRVWMDFEVFVKCFRTLYVYHKPYTYPCNQRYSDLKNVSATPGNISAKIEKKPTPAALSQPPSDSSAPLYLFVDNLEATDIVVSYSVLTRWFDPPPLPSEEKERKSVTSIRPSKEKDIEKEISSMLSLLDEKTSSVSELKLSPQATQGSIVAEPYSWKSLVVGQPILRLRTTGTKSTVLSLPSGRHVLRFTMTSPLGHHVHMCSTVNFLVGDEETIMAQLTSESLKFREYAIQIMTNLGNCISAFSDLQQLNIAWADLCKSHCPYLDDNKMSKTHHFEIFNQALYQMIRKVLKEIITPEIALAWRAFSFDATTPNILGLAVGSRPDDESEGGLVMTSAGEVEKAKSQDMALKSQLYLDNGPLEVVDRKSRAYSLAANKMSIHQEIIHDSRSASEEKVSDLRATASHRSSGSRVSSKKQSQSDTGETEKSDVLWTTRDPNVDEMVAAVKIGKIWRGYYVRKIKESRTPGTSENAKVTETLKRCWSMIEPNLEENGLYLLREMFRRDSDIMPFYPFYKDEWSKISYADYRGIFPEQGPMNWFLVFRDIFYVKEDMLVIPSMQVPINTCLLHVIDNDTMQELPRVFQKVAPYVYKINKKGYSFVAEARTEEQALGSGLWRMRLIGSLSALPATQTGDVCCNFVTKQIIDYYVPNSKNIVFRYSVRVREDHFASLQMNTSKRGVYIKLAVLNNEEEVISATGKGHVVIPAFTFLKNVMPEDAESRRSGSRASTVSPYKKTDEGEFPLGNGSANKNSPLPAYVKGEKTERVPSKSRRAESIVSSEQAPSQISVKSEAEVTEGQDSPKLPKYIIQATVLQNSWPLSESSWRFVQTLKDMEKLEQKSPSIKELSPASSKMEKPSAASSKIKVKPSKEKVGKDKNQDSRQSQSQAQLFDFTRPHWTLRVVSDASAADIEIKKDDERAEEIKAIKKAWEDAQPGRAAKALQSRMKYLNSHAIKLPPEQSVEVGPVDSVSSVSGAGTETVVSSDQDITHVTLPPFQPPFFNESETGLTLEPPPSLQKKVMLEPIDITPFIRKTLPEPIYKDEEVIEKMLEKRQKEIADYKVSKERFEKWRETDKQNRNLAKMKQLEQYQALQAAVDAARNRINMPREAIRQRFLEQERHRLEELAAHEAALKAEKDAKSPKGRKKSTASAKKKP